MPAKTPPTLPRLRLVVLNDRAPVRDMLCKWLEQHGHHCDTRWLSLRRADGSGVLVSGAPMLEFNASRFDQMDLTKARHTTEVKDSGFVHLHLDAAHRGLGTASCGPDAFEQYRVKPGQRYQLAYRMIPLAKGEDAAVAHRTAGFSPR